MKRISVFVIVTLLTIGFSVAVSHAADVRGKYEYQANGYKGIMIIKWMKGQEGRAYAFTFKTVSKTNGQMCEFEAVEMPSRIQDDKPAHGKSDSGAKFKIAFKGNTAIVTVVARGGECGMSGSFGGNYVKVKK